MTHSPAIHRLDPEGHRLAEALDWIQHQAAANGLIPAKTQRLLLAVEELLVNIISYSGSKAGIELACEVEGSWFRVILRDRGVAFDPLAMKTPKRHGSVAEREIGGLGIHLAREMADRIVYRQLPGGNETVVAMTRDDGGTDAV